MIKSEDNFLEVKSQSNFVYWLIVVLLVALIASNSCFATLAQQERQAQVESNEARHAIYEEHVQQIQTLLVTEYRVIAGVRDAYRVDAYDSSIDRIAEQQLIAAEYQMLLLQVIAQQNAQMIELMTTMGP